MRLAASRMVRGIMQLSHTAMTSRVSPLSKAKQRACNSSWVCAAARSLKYPLMEIPRRGVMLLVAAPARNWRGPPAGLAGESAGAAKPERGSCDMRVKRSRTKPEELNGLKKLKELNRETSFGHFFAVAELVGLLQYRVGNCSQKE